MQYSRLGNSGLIISRLAFGAMTFGTGAGPFASVSKVDEANAKTMVDASRSMPGSISSIQQTAMPPDNPRSCWENSLEIDEKMS